MALIALVLVPATPAAADTLSLSTTPATPVGSHQMTVTAAGSTGQSDELLNVKLHFTSTYSATGRKCKSGKVRFKLKRR